MKGVVPSEAPAFQGGADELRRAGVRLLQIHGSRTALKVYLTIAIGVFTSVIVIASLVRR